ncbi:enoyl-CoA hydratase-related protein, partial [Photobacterium sanctipauli]
MTEKAQQNTSQKAQHNDDVVFELDKRGIATLTLNRPQKRNAFNAECISLLREHLAQLTNTPGIRGLVLKANGEFFSAGADLAWMQAMVNKSMDENIADAEQLAGLLRDLDTFPHPTIAIVQGSAFGGALGLICCCDIVIAQKGCEFSFSEVKLGLVPATIAPYAVRAIGQRQARRFMLTAEKFDSATAQQLGM